MSTNIWQCVECDTHYCGFCDDDKQTCEVCDELICPDCKNNDAPEKRIICISCNTDDLPDLTNPGQNNIDKAWVCSVCTNTYTNREHGPPEKCEVCDHQYCYECKETCAGDNRSLCCSCDPDDLPEAPLARCKDTIDCFTNHTDREPHTREEI